MWRIKETNNSNLNEICNWKMQKLIISTDKQQRITQNSVLMYPQYRYRSVKRVRT